MFTEFRVFRSLSYLVCVSVCVRVHACLRLPRHFFIDSGPYALLGIGTSGSVVLNDPELFVTERVFSRTEKALIRINQCLSPGRGFIYNMRQFISDSFGRRCHVDVRNSPLQTCLFTTWTSQHPALQRGQAAALSARRLSKLSHASLLHVKSKLRSY